MRRRALRIWAAAGGLLLFVWLLLAFWGIPALIRSAYASQSLPFLNDIFAGRDVHPVERYLRLWRSLTWPATAALVVVLAAIGLSIRFAEARRRAIRVVVGGTHELTFGALLRYALVMGALGGIAEIGYRTARQLILSQPYAGYYPELLWMTPVAAACAYVLIALVLGGVARVLSSRVGLAQATFLFVFLTLFAVAQLRGISLHIAAEVILAAGLASAAARAALGRAHQLGRLVRRLTPVVAVLLAGLLTVGLFWVPPAAERRALSRLAAPRAGIANVVLIILDTVRAANLSVYGYHRDTSPNIAAWAAHGVVFDRATSTAPWTLPSHASMFTGEYNFVLRTGFRRPLDEERRTLAEVLRDQGYATAAFVANLGYTSRASGLHRGFARYEDFPVGPAMFLRSSWVLDRMTRPLRRFGITPRWGVPKRADAITDRFLAWLGRRDERPFFVFLNYFDAHSPYVAPQPFRGKFGPLPTRTRSDKRLHTTEELAPWINAYDGCIAYIDHQLQRIFSRLEETGLGENTLVILTSDHGEMWGEHGHTEHTAGLYLPSLHVPFVMVYPRGLPEGVRVTEPVTLRDLPATVLDILGVTGAARLPGRSLASLWNGGEDGQLSPLVSELDYFDSDATWKPILRGDMKSLVEGRLHYIRNGDGVEELYDVVADPTETDDLVATAAARDGLMRLRAALDSALSGSQSQ